MFAKRTVSVCSWWWLSVLFSSAVGCVSPSSGRRPEVVKIAPPGADLQGERPGSGAAGFWNEDRPAAPRRVSWRPPAHPGVNNDQETMYFPSVEEGWDAADFLARVQGTLAAGMRGDAKAAYHHFLELPEPTPETRLRAGYHGEIPSVEARKALQEIAGEVFTDETGIFGGGKWEVGSWVVRPNPVTRHGPIVPLWRPGAEKKIPRSTPSGDVFILPILTDGDAADLYKRVTGENPLQISGELSLRYKSVWRQSAKPPQDS